MTTVGGKTRRVVARGSAQFSKLRPEHISVQIIDGKYNLSTGAAPETSVFVRVRADLNAIKSQFDKYNENEATRRLWGMFQNAIDLYKELRFHVAATFNAQATTNAWLKYHEIIIEHELIATRGPLHRAFFNAEFPGGFVAAHNHYMKTERRSRTFEWRASSLMEGLATGNDVALGDKYGLYAQNRDNWMMNEANNGDATSAANIRDWAARIGPKSSYGGVDLYSHDAGMDVSDDYNNQESTNAKLHLGCALAGFATMKIGACFIAKQYTIFETLSWNLILIYANLFDEFRLCKPLTSRPYNSEIYLIGKGFRGIDDTLFEQLIARLDTPHARLIDARADDPAVISVREFCDKMFGQQTRFLQENLALMQQYGTSRESIHRLQDLTRPTHQACQRDWIKAYPVEFLPYNDWLPALKKGAAEMLFGNAD